MPPSGDSRKVFVGREQLLVQVLCGLEHGTSLRAHDLSGPYGIGKSALLGQARQRSDEGGAFAAIAVDMVDHDPGYAGQVGDALTYPEAVRNFDELKHLGAAVLGQLSDEVALRFQVAADAAWLPVLEIKTQDVNVWNELKAQGSTVINSPQNINLTFDPRSAYDAQIVTAIRKAGLALTDALIAFLNEATCKRPVLLLVDNVDRIVDQEIGLWLRRVLGHLERAVVVLTHEPGTTLALPEGLAQSMRVPPLSLEEVDAYLRKRMQDEPSTDLVALIHSFTGGLPIAVRLLVELLQDDGVGLQASDLENRLARLPKDPADRLAGVVTRMVDRVKGRPLGQALRAASIPHECDAELLGVLLDGLGTPPDAASELLQELEAFSFTDEFDSSTGAYSVSVHPVIRHALAERMRKYEPHLSGKLHGLAAAYHFDKVVHAKGYDDMFGYEEPEQQARLRKWLYHQAHSDDPTATLRQSAFVFLDAFWWWGNYVQLDFCETLALDFRVVADETGDPRLRDFAGAVNRLIEAYPYRAKLRQDFDRRYPSAPWDEVRDALLEIQELCEVVDLGPEPEEVEQHVAALLEIFLAHSHRYQSRRGGVDAAECYERAAALLEELEEWWDLPWVVFEQADLALECGDPGLARARAAEAARLLYEHIDNKNPDEELIANLHRLRADCLLDEGDVDGAAREYGVAVVHSYLFHAIGGPPDDYTMQFYFEMRGRAVEKLLRLWGEGQADAAIRAAGLMLESFPRNGEWPAPSPAELREMLESGTIFALAHAMFPRGPDLGELGDGSSAFMKDLRRIRNTVGRGLRRDLEVNVSSRTDE